MIVGKVPEKRKEKENTTKKHEKKINFKTKHSIDLGDTYTNEEYVPFIQSLQKRMVDT